MKRFFSALFCILVFATLSFSEGINKIEFKTDITSQDGSMLCFVSDDTFSIEWEDENKAFIYMVSFISDSVTVEDRTVKTNYLIKGLKENDIGTFRVRGLDAAGNIISDSENLIVAYPPQEINKLDIEKPSVSVLTGANYSKEDKSSFKFNYVMGMDKFRVKIYTPEKTYLDKLQVTNKVVFPSSIDDGVTKRLSVEVSALSDENTIASEMFYIDYYNEIYKDYDIRLIAYDQNKPYWSNYIRLDIVDDHQSLLKTDYTYYKVTVKNEESGFEEVYYSRIYNGDFDDPKIIKKLDDGGYDVEVKAFRILSFIDGFESSIDSDLDEIINSINKVEILGMSNLHIEVLGSGNMIYAPSDWAKESIVSIADYLPNNINFNYKDSITRADACRVLISIYKEYKEIDTITEVSNRRVFADTIDPFINLAYTNNIVKGKEQGIFDPDGFITREEFAVMIANTFKSQGYDIEFDYSLPFNDKNMISDWAKDSIGYLYQKGVFLGTTEGGFNPKSNITKEEAFVVISRLKY